MSCRNKGHPTDWVHPRERARHRWSRRDAGSVAAQPRNRSVGHIPWAPAPRSLGRPRRRARDTVEEARWVRIPGEGCEQMDVKQSAALSLGRDEFAASGRVLRWSVAGGVGGALLLAMTRMSFFEPGRSAAGDLLLTVGLLLLAVALLGVMFAVRSGREIRFGPDGAVVIHRHVLPSRRYVGVAQIVLDERSWGLAVPVVTGFPPATGQGLGPDAGAPGMAATPDLGSAALAAVLADGREIPLGEIEWEDRRATAERAARIIGADVTVRRTSAVASCG
jgi:hypothetical protein